ncbi:MAG TPA: PQQ-dependent sugar dehydrogenase, partial [Candidatus Defluviicoccus seviourii]|nr:PQQ-dependent sugar dehydrogenase [Candidatus Defluviicoccus seviourii]
MIPRLILLASVALAASVMVNGAAQAQSINAGDRTASATQPFTARPVAQFITPWAIASLPDGRMLITEKPGRIFLVTQGG